MAKAKTENLVMLPLLDRLADVDDWPTTRQQSMRQYRDSLKRDVEDLLNSRRPPIKNIHLYPRAAASVINYGLPDIHSYSNSTDDQNALVSALLQTLRRYEPRLLNVRVTVVRSETLSRSLRFHMEGQLQFEHTVENIEFDTVLELTRDEYKVK